MPPNRLTRIIKKL